MIWICFSFLLAVPRVLKEIDDENIFFSKKGVRVAHAISSKSKSSNDKGHDSDSDWEGLDGKDRIFYVSEGLS